MQIKIEDNKEPLVDIKKYCPGIVIDIDAHRMRIEKTVYLRLTVAKMLHKAQKALPEGMNLIIGDAWRPAFIQAQIYFWFISTFSNRYPNWSRKQVIREIENFVSLWKGKGASGHMTGGAVDLRIVNRHGRKIPMKYRRLNYQENALSDQKKLPAYARRNRDILFQVMQKAGFSNNPKEYWHWMYGDYYWAKRNKKPVAIYGIVADVNHLYEKQLCPCGLSKKFKKCHGV